MQQKSLAYQSPLKAKPEAFYRFRDGWRNLMPNPNDSVPNRRISLSKIRSITLPGAEARIRTPELLRDKNPEQCHVQTIDERESVWGICLN
ncbi:MAG: hypothetical protein ACW987_14635 [Candidatus Thorarchaeota archaeon]